MLFRWIAQVFRYLLGGHPLEANVGFVNSVEPLWSVFCESETVTRLLLSNDDDNNALKEWEEQLRIALSLCQDLDREGNLDMGKIAPILFPLVVGTYLAQQQQQHCDASALSTLRNNGQDMVLHALIDMSSLHSCPTSAWKYLVETHPEQLRVLNPLTGRLPLHSACVEMILPEKFLVVLEAYPQAASVPDSNGSYPLHLACESCYCYNRLNWQGGISQLLLAAPHVLHCPNSDGQKILVATALVYGEQEWRYRQYVLEHVNTMFELLRCDPTVVREWMSNE